MREAIIFYLKPFPIELPLVRPFKHEFKDIFQENDWCFDGKKLNLNAFRRIQRTNAQLSRYGINSSASKTCVMLPQFSLIS